MKAKIVQNIEPIKDIRELKSGTSVTTVPVSVTMLKRIPRGSHRLSFEQPKNFSNLGFIIFITGKSMTGYVKNRAIARQDLINKAQGKPPSSGGSKFIVMRSAVSGPNDK